jgi:hypothetical protein
MTQDVFVISLIVILAAISFVFAWRQVKTWKWLKTQEQMQPEDRKYYRRQIIRRLIGCGLTLTLAGMLIGMLPMMKGLDELGERGEQAKKDDTKLTDEEKAFMRSSLTYVGVLMLVLFVLLIVVFLDVVSIRRFGMRHRKRIRDDRKAMLMRQLPLLRRDREEREES